MEYRMNIISEESVQTRYCTGYPNKNVELIVGEKYNIVHDKPTTKKDRENNGRVVEILGFTGEFMGYDAIVRYLDTKRRGRVHVNCLLPYEE